MRRSAIMRGLATVFLGASILLAGCGETSQRASDDGSPQTVDEGIRDWQVIKESGVLRIGTEGTYSPYSYHDFNGQLTGYDIELAEAIADKLGLSVAFTEMGFDGLAAGLDAGKFDVVANQICVTPEREEKYMFSKPYAYVTGAVITRDDTSGIDSFENLDGKQVALTVTSNWAKLAESYGAEIVSTGGFSESMQMVIDKRADATVNDNIVFLDYTKQHPTAPVRIAAESSEIDTVALMMTGNQDDLKDQIDSAMDELRKEGFMTSLSNKYFGEDVSLPRD